MQITTWNVNGYRAALNKGLKEWAVKEQSDVYCLQEVKATIDQVPAHGLEFGDYQVEWNAAKRPGYSGVATIAHSHLGINSQFGIGEDKFDQEGRVIQSKVNGYTLFNIYFPSGQRDYGRVEFKLEFYEKLLALLTEKMKNGESLIITGDFNTAHQEIDLANPKSNQQTSGFLPEERAMVDKYLSHGLVDIFRLKYPDRKQYTWWTYRSGARERNIGWRLDYFLITPDLVSKVNDVVVHDNVLGSDHCPVSLLLNE